MNLLIYFTRLCKTKLNKDKVLNINSSYATTMHYYVPTTVQ